MDVTPEVLHEVEFRAKVRGYDPDEVDDFLERVAAGVGDLQERLRAAVERAAAAESKVAELKDKVKSGGGSSAAETDDTLRRTLVLAQRTADAAISEANEEAERTRTDARDQADKLVTEAEQRAAAILKDAEDEVRKGVDATRQRLVSEIIDLEAARDSIRADVAALERHLDEQRLRLRGAVADLQRLVDDPASLKGMPAPLLTEATLPAKFVPEPVIEEPEDAVAEPEAAVVDVEIDEHEVLPGEPTEAVEAVDLDLTDDDHEDEDEAELRDIFAPPRDEPVVSEGRIGLFDDLDTDLESRGFEFDEPGTLEPVGRIPEGPEGDDAYLAELRKAMLTTDADDEESDELPPLGPDELAPAPKFRSRFGRRR